MKAAAKVKATVRPSSTLQSSPLQKSEQIYPKHKDLKLKTAKNNCVLSTRVCVGYQSAGGDLDKFFQHENQSFPPSILDKWHKETTNKINKWEEKRKATFPIVDSSSISDSGDQHHGNKSDLLQCFERIHDPELTEPQVSAVLIDGATLVHILKPAQAKTFQEYSDSVFVPYVLMCLSTADRVDIVWDCYRDNSLKLSESLVRKERGQIRR